MKSLGNSRVIDMDLLLDTHLAYWYILGNERIPSLAKELISDRSNRVFVSLASAWEIGIKHAKNKEAMPMDAENFIKGCEEVGFVILPLVEDQLLSSFDVPLREELKHKDPFDRFLLGASKAINARFLTHDAKIALYESPYILFI